MTDRPSDTASTLNSVTGSGRPGGTDEPTVGPSRPVHPYLHVVVVAVIGGVSVLAWLLLYEALNRLVWENDVVTANPWLFPVICLPFSLVVGLLVKYRHAPTNLDESMIESLSGDVSKIDWRTLPVNIVMALVSLLAGAVIGPEGGIGGISSKIAALYGEKVRCPSSTAPSSSSRPSHRPTTASWRARCSPASWAPSSSGTPRRRPATCRPT